MVRHLVDINELTLEDIYQLLNLALKFKSFNNNSSRRHEKMVVLQGKTVVNAFFEPSTRTRVSFELAAKRLGAEVLNFSAASSSTSKGETLLDTMETIDAMQVDLIVARHKYSGFYRILAEHTGAPIINAGDGLHQHPTQTLLDLLTMRQRFGEETDAFKNKKVGIIGDVVHSRVAGSLAPTLKRLGAQPIFIAPPSYLPSSPASLGAEVSYSLDEVLPSLDVVYLLRIQGERANGLAVPSLDEYSLLYGMNSIRLKATKKDAIIMHPGPINRGVELTDEVAADSRAVILNQVNAGVAVRMAAMALILEANVSSVLNEVNDTGDVFADNASAGESGSESVKGNMAAKGR